MITSQPLKNKQHGATIAEFIVVTSFVLVPLLILMPLLGKYIDTQHKVEQAARYGAWEHTAWFDSASPAFTGRASGMLPFTLQSKDATVIENEIQRRILAKADTSIHSKQGQGNDKYELDAMQYYTQRSSYQYQPLLIKASNQSPVYGSYKGSESEPKGAVNKGISAVLKVGDIVGFQVNTKGLYTSQFQLDLHEPSWMNAFKNLDVKFVAQHSLFTDGWGSGGKEHNIAMVQGLLPTSLFAKDLPKKLAKYISKVPIAREVSPDELIFGHVDVDSLPTQRLMQ